MKKLIFTIILACAAFSLANAQSVSSLPRAARLAYYWLSDEGYRPYIDEDGDVSFKAQGYYFYVSVNESDPDYLKIVMPGIKNVDMDADDSLIAAYCALAACNEMTRDYKIVKAYMSDSGKVSLACSTYIDDTPLVGDYLDTAIDFMIEVNDEWRRTYNDLMED